MHTCLPFSIPLLNLILISLSRTSRAHTAFVGGAFVGGGKTRSILTRIHQSHQKSTASPPSPINNRIQQRYGQRLTTQIASATTNEGEKNSSSEKSGEEQLSYARRSLPEGYVLREIPGKGTGVITTRSIPQNTVIGDYVGEILTQDEKDRRYLPSQAHIQTEVDKAWIRSRLERGQTITGSYIYGVTVPNNKPPIYIDSEDEDVGGWTRYINHSSEWYGCNLIPKSVHESWDGNPRVWFVTTRDIKAGEELCFDYGDDYWLDGDVVA